MHNNRGWLVALALLAVPTALVGAALAPGRVLLPADLLLQFEPWRSSASSIPHAYWDPLVWDGVAQYYPWRLFAAESLRAGVLPLWNPHQFCGTPFLANGQSAVFYPLNVLFWLLPVSRAFGWSAWLHLVLTGWFAYRFLRRARVAPSGSVAGAIVWQGNAFLVAWIHLPTVLCTVAWLPLVLLWLDRAVRSGRARFAAAAGVALGCGALAGHPQMLQLVLLMTLVYGISRGLASDLGRSLRHRLARLVLTGGVTGVVAGGLAAVQLLPTLDLLRIAHRTFNPGPDSYRAYLAHALPPIQLIQLLLPHAFGHPAHGSYVGRDNYAEFAAYIGVVALALAVIGIASRRVWHARFFWLFALMALLVVLGTPVNWPLYQWFPGFSRAGGPGRMLVLVAFSLSMLAGLGFEHLLEQIRAQRRAAVAAFIAVLSLFACLLYVWKGLVTPALAEIEPAVSGLSDREVARGALLCLAAAVVAALAWRFSVCRRLAPVLLLALLGLDLFLASGRHVHVTPSAWAYPAISVGVPPQGRILGNARDWPIDRFPIAALPPNTATVYGFREVFGYDSLYLSQFRDFAAAVQHGDPSPPLNGNMLLARLDAKYGYGLDMMSLAAVETVVSPVRVHGLDMERVGAYYIYDNPYAQPRAWVASSAIVVPNHTEAVVSLAQLGPMPDCVLLTSDGEFPLQPLTGTPSVTLTDVSPNRVDVDIEEGEGGCLFLADAFAPGWHAYADQRELPIAPAYVAFRGVPLPSDANSVTLRYEPAAFRVGLFLALAVIGSLVATGVLVACRPPASP